MFHVNEPITKALHLSLNSEGRWGTTDDFTTSFLYSSLFSTAFRDLVNSRPVHSLILSSHLFFCLPYLLSPFAVPGKMVLAEPDEQETCPYHCSLHLFKMVRRSSCGLITCWILAWTSLLVISDLSTHLYLPVLRWGCSWVRQYVCTVKKYSFGDASPQKNNTFLWPFFCFKTFSLSWLQYSARLCYW